MGTVKSLKCGLLILSTLFLKAHADVPYDSLEKIRQFTVVTQVLVDSKDKLKACRATKNHSELSEKLAAAYSHEAVVWDNAQIVLADLKLLRERALNCKSRGSCEIYSQFLTRAVRDQASATEVQKLRDEVNSIYKKVQPRDYENALKSISEPCKVLSDLVEN